MLSSHNVSYLNEIILYINHWLMIELLKAGNKLMSTEYDWYAEEIKCSVRGPFRLRQEETVGLFMKKKNLPAKRLRASNRINWLRGNFSFWK